ncbi:PEPxxWA-CTERM sorting domain-containing protein [Sphingomonas sp. MMS24-J13]|uniref:PEPxxWA-CTERM sorting domain-containing protein n=1 Tax=Sphingomonas sp. MMS24-J13 TaxID=3238686 RepID=UPI00384E7810
MVSTKWAMGAIVGAAMFAAVPASATVTFADYQPIDTSNNIGWQNNGSGGSGSGGSIYTIAPGASTPGSVQIKFSFLLPGLDVVSGVTANFTLLATATNAPALTDGSFFYQPTIAGNFSIISTSAITVAGHTYASGSNLLSATFTDSGIFGGVGSTSGELDSTGDGSTITYTSDFLNFAPTVNRDFALSLASIASKLRSNNANTALGSFSGNSSGNFSSDPAPLPIFAVPEAATWGMFIGGFGLIGASLRRRREYSLA